jgi:hypothetical protein
MVSTGVIFACTHMCTFFFTEFIFLPPSPYHLHLPIGANNPPWQDLYYLPSFWFCRRKKKKWWFCLFEIKVVIKGVSLLIMFYNHNWFISSIFLHSTLVPFLW